MWYPSDVKGMFCFACVDLGVEVTVLERRDDLLNADDDEEEAEYEYSARLAGFHLAIEPSTDRRILQLRVVFGPRVSDRIVNDFKLQ